MYGIARNAVFQALRSSRAKVVGRPQSFRIQKLGQQQMSRNACGFGSVSFVFVSVLFSVLGFSFTLSVV